MLFSDAVKYKQEEEEEEEGGKTQTSLRSSLGGGKSGFSNVDFSS